ncbi:class I SAM-dependent methyltransferase [Eilatimonas milleporae]|uniref:Methyltransferase family protein n=1 Tax=Eilatimonas milleporae TaxID=911205 RepID=A0A3M0CRP0_9PROT|nr:class I SAM-dependent methyltransferase [Eilatimonas milleporae]RMB12234.1 methyltransferase family protein [Eilatimonas milleporae]
MTKPESIDVPPPWHLVGQHAVFPKARHDEIARFNFLANMNKHLAQTLGPGNKLAYETRVLPALRKELGRDPENRHEIRRAMNKDPYHRFWSALKRNTMEQRQQAGRSMVLRQIDDLVAAAKDLNAGSDRLNLDPTTDLPNYVKNVDHHCMPGSYHTELMPDDVSAGANYDCGLFVTTGGALGTYSDGGGKAVAEWATSNPDFRPKRILDVGCTLGHNMLPIAEAYPDAEVTGIDVGAPVLRYGHARAKALGVDNVRFVQMNAEDLSRFEDESFDWVQTTMYLHETSNAGMARMMKEFYRVLAPGGLLLHVEQPQYTDDMPLYEQFIRDWDAFNNNEPFWSKVHELDLQECMADAGFSHNEMFVTGVRAVVDSDVFPAAKTGDLEDHGRAAAWHAFGAWKGMNDAA